MPPPEPAVLKEVIFREPMSLYAWVIVLYLLTAAQFFCMFWIALLVNVYHLKRTATGPVRPSLSLSHWEYDLRRVGRWAVVICVGMALFHFWYVYPVEARGHHLQFHCRFSSFIALAGIIPWLLSIPLHRYFQKHAARRAAAATLPPPP